MVTRDQALNAGYRATFHFTGKHACGVTTGARGARHETVTRVRVSGTCKTWKRDLERFHMPIKYGMYESWHIDQDNADQFHSPADCPAGIAF